LNIISIGSSSKGNCTLIYNDDTYILIDCGIAVKKIKEATHREHFDAVFITHEHGDHIKNAGPFGRATQTPIYVSDLVVKKLEAKNDRFFENCIIENIDDVSSYKIGSMTITPFSTKHDAAQAFGFKIEDKDTKICYLTDTGSISKRMLDMIKDCNNFFIECDYDEDLLRDYDEYDEELKQRISSDFGHLSTQQMMELVESLGIDNVNMVVVGHLSERTNSPEKVKERLAVKFPNHLAKFIVTPYTGVITL